MNEITFTPPSSLYCLPPTFCMHGCNDSSHCTSSSIMCWNVALQSERLSLLPWRLLELQWESHLIIHRGASEIKANCTEKCCCFTSVGEGSGHREVQWTPWGRSQVLHTSFVYHFGRDKKNNGLHGCIWMWGILFCHTFVLNMQIQLHLAKTCITNDISWYHLNKVNLAECYGRGNVNKLPHIMCYSIHRLFMGKMLQPLYRRRIIYISHTCICRKSIIHCRSPDIYIGTVTFTDI